MKNNMKTCKRKDGYVLLLCLIFISLLAMGSTLLIYTTKQKVFATKKNIAHLKAQIIAEAGIYKSVSAIKNDTALLTQTCPDVQTTNGTATISIQSASSGSTGDYSLTSTSSFEGETATAAVMINFTGTPGGTTEDPEVLKLFDAALFCGGDSNMSGGGGIDLAGATAHVNGTLTMVGSASFKNGGAVSSSTKIEISGGSDDRIVGAVTTPVISLPSWAKDVPGSFITGIRTETAVPKQMIEIDLEPYRLFAAATDTSGDYSNSKWNDLITDTYISEDEMPKNGTLNIGAKQVVRPSGGVLWVEGSIKFAGSSEIDGCVIATGDIEVLGGMTHKNPNGLPAFMSVNGDVLVGSGCQVYGLVYAHNGSIKIQGAANVTGAFICPRGDFTDCGSGSVVYDNSRPSGPNGENVMLPQTTDGSSGTPTVVGWVE